MTDSARSGATEVGHHKTWGIWKLGDALWWRDEAGIHGTILTKEPVYGPKGGRKEAGVLTEIHAPTMEDVNRQLNAWGFDDLQLDESEIKWHGKAAS